MSLFCAFTDDKLDLLVVCVRGVLSGVGPPGIVVRVSGWVGRPPGAIVCVSGCVSRVPDVVDCVRVPVKVKGAGPPGTPCGVKLVAYEREDPPLELVDSVVVDSGASDCVGVEATE